MFKVEKQTTGKIKQIKLINTETQEYTVIIPQCGGVLNELVLNKGGRNYAVINGYSSNDELREYVMHKGAKLIPFPNRIKDGTYIFAGKTYQLPINLSAEHHAIHGFIYDKEFTVVNTESGEDGASVELEYIYHGDHPGYPFKFSIKLKYFLTRENGCKCTTMVQNIHDEPMPFGDGWHPYFTLGKKADDLLLKLPSRLITEVDDRMIPTSRVLRLDRFNRLNTIGRSRFDTGFRLEPEENVVTTEIYDPESDVKIKIYQETGNKKYNFLQIYIPPARDTIAVEPMTCDIDAFNNGRGLIVLEPGERFEASYGVMLE